MNATYSQTYQTNGRPVTNPKLIGDMRAGVGEAWSEFFAVYWGWLLGVAGRMGVCSEDAKDLVQKTFIALSNHISEFIYERAKGRFSGWLLTVLKRNIFTYWTARQTDPLSLLQKPSDKEMQTEPIHRLAGPPQYEVISEVIVNEIEQLLRESYNELKAQISAKHWAIFEAYNIQERAVEEVAAQFGLRPGTIYSIDCRCMRVLRRIVTRKLEAARKGGQAFAGR